MKHEIYISANPPRPAPERVLKELEAQLRKYAEDHDLAWMHEAAHQMTQLREGLLWLIVASKKREGGAK